MGALFSVLVVAAVLAWWWKGRRDGASVTTPQRGSGGYRVVFRAGRVESVEGHIARATLSAFEDIAAHADLEGEVQLVGLTELQFSEDVPPGVRQQLRNAHVTSMHVH